MSARVNATNELYKEKEDIVNRVEDKWSYWSQFTLWKTAEYYQVILVIEITKAIEEGVPMEEDVFETHRRVMSSIKVPIPKEELNFATEIESIPVISIGDTSQ